MLIAQLLPTAPRGTPVPPRKAPANATATPQHDQAVAAQHDHAAAPHDHAAPRAHGRAGDAETFDPVEELALLRREQVFDLTTKQHAELEREANVLRDMAMAQLKKDDENLKKWIAMI